MSGDLASLGLRFETHGYESSIRAMDTATGTAEKLERATDILAESQRKAAETAIWLGRAIGGFAATFVTRQVIDLADAWSDLNSRVRLATGSVTSGADSMDRLAEIARRTYSSLNLTTESYIQNAKVLKDLGYSTQQQLDYTEALNLAMVVSGAKAERAAQIQDALSRAQALGALRGDQLNTVIMNGGRVAEVLAEELGIGLSQLRAFGAQGKITGDVIYNALTTRLQQLQDEAESMPATVGDAMTLLGNAALRTTGLFDETGRVSERFAKSIVAAADGITYMGRVLTGAEKPGRALDLTLKAIGITASLIAARSLIGLTTAVTGNVVAMIAGSTAVRAYVMSVAMVGPASATAIAATNALRAAMLAVPGLALVAVVGALVAGMGHLATTTMSAEAALRKIKDSGDGYMDALKGLKEWQDAYGLSTKTTNALMDEALGITAQTNSMADEAAKAAYRRAAQERALTHALLMRRAAEAQGLGAQLDTSARNNRAMGHFFSLSMMSPGLSDNRFQQATKESEQATAQYEQATRLYRLAAGIMRDPLPTDRRPTGRPPATETVTGGSSKESDTTNKAIEDSQRFLEALQQETREIGLNAEAKKLMAIVDAEAAAKLSGNDGLAAAIRQAGADWLKASRDFAADEGVRKATASLEGLRTQLERQAAAIGKTPVEMARLNAEWAIADMNIKDLTPDLQKLIDQIIELAEVGAKAREANPFAAIADDLRLIDDMALRAGHGMASAFGDAGRAMGDLLTSMTGFQSAMAAINRDEAERRLSGAQAARERAAAEIQSYGDMAAAAKGFFREGSDGYKLLQAAEQGYRLFQFAMSVQAMAMGSTETAASVAQSATRGAASMAAGAAKMFEFLGPLGFPAVAAMLGLLAGLGLKGKGGGGGRGYSAANDDIGASVETARSQTEQQERAQDSAAQSVAAKVQVMVEFNDPMFRARVQKETGPMIATAAASAAGYAKQDTMKALVDQQRGNRKAVS